MALFPRSDPEPLPPAVAPLLVSQGFVTQCFQVSIASLLVYETIITMDKEVRYFWKNPLNLVNLVYFANRYIGIYGVLATIPFNLFNVSMGLCKFSVWSRNMSNWMTGTLINYILMIRVLAFYSEDKIVPIVLKALLALEAMMRLGINISITFVRHVAVGALAKNATVCGFDNLVSSRWGVLDQSVPLVYGVILMLLAIYKAAEFWKLSAGLKGFTLVRVLIQDQVYYFILAIFTCVMSLLEIKIARNNAFVANILNWLGSPAFLCILGSRMLINLKEAGEEGRHEGTNHRVDSHTVSEIQFA